MCEKCDQETDNLSDTMDETMNLAKTFTHRMIEFSNNLLKEQHTMGPPALTLALSITLGRLIGVAPEAIRAEVLQQSVRDMTAALNSVLPDGQSVTVFTGATKTYGEQPEPASLTVRPPVIH